MKKYRIKDIAALSGVSTGTVDRIIHKRGKVSEEARKKVEKVLKEIDYHPNLIARSLASKKVFRLAVLIPSFLPGEYWEDVKTGINQAGNEFSIYNVVIEYHSFDQYDVHSYNRVLNKLKINPDYQGYILPTLFQEETIDFTRELDKHTLPYVLIDAYIENTNLLAYYGTHSYDSGFIAGKLMYEGLTDRDEVVMFMYQKQGMKPSTQVINRQEGFKNYLSAQSVKHKLHAVTIYSDNEEGNKQILSDFFKAHPQVKGGIIFNSRVHLIASYLKDMSMNDLMLIGYDATEANIAELNEGVVGYIITQRPEVQGYNSVKALFRFLALEEKNEKLNFMPIDILIKENVKYYNNYI